MSVKRTKKRIPSILLLGTLLVTLGLVSLQYKSSYSTTKSYSSQEITEENGYFLSHKAWMTFNESFGAYPVSFMLPQPRYCGGCIDSTPTTFSVSSRGDNELYDKRTYPEKDWLFLFNYYQQDRLSLDEPYWSNLSGNFITDLDSILINETKIIDGYEFTRLADTLIDGQAAKVYDSNVTSQNANKSRWAVLYKNGYLISIIYEWTSPEDDKNFQKIIDSMKFTHRDHADYPEDTGL